MVANPNMHRTARFSDTIPGCAEGLHLIKFTEEKKHIVQNQPKENYTNAITNSSMA